MALFTPKNLIPAYQTRMRYHAMLLSFVCGLVGFLILILDMATKDKIAEEIKNDKLEILKQVIPINSYDNDIIEDIATIEEQGKIIKVNIARKDKYITGVSLSSVSDGYGGPIKIIMGLDRHGNINGVRVLSHKETPGLGDKIEIAKDQWIKSFDGRSLRNTSKQEWAVKKDGGVFDQFTGATITPRAVVKAAHKGLVMFERHKGELMSEPPKKEEASDAISKTLP